MDDSLNNNDFFNQAAKFYDLMIPFNEAVERKKIIFTRFRKPGMELAADIGCGTGIDSIALSKLDLKVSGFDYSIEMLNQAKLNAKIMKANVNFHNYSVEEIPAIYNIKFDLVVSSGNTFANVSKENLDSSLKKCFNLLKRNGVLLIHILNYKKILTEKNRIVSINQNDNNIFIRFYDFETDHIIFNILKVNKSQLSEHSIISTKLFPHLKDDLEGIINSFNFQSVDYYKDFECHPFDELNSKDLIISAVK